MIGRFLANACASGVILVASQAAIADSGCGPQTSSATQTQVWVPRAQADCAPAAPQVAASTSCAPCQQVQAAPACVQMKTVYQAVPKVTEVDRVETVMQEHGVDMRRSKRAPARRRGDGGRGARRR